MAARLVSWCVCVAALVVIEVAAQNTPVPPQPAIVAIRNVTVIPATSGAAPIAGATVVITGAAALAA
jgi:hypothetical protein